MDRGRFHLSRQLDWPENLIPIYQPAHCPELNPIERLWEYVKAQLRWENCHSLDELRQQVYAILAQMTPTVIASLTSWDFIRIECHYIGFLTFQTSSKQVSMEIPKKITLRVGEINTVRLPGLGTTGYVWTHQVIENSGLIEVSEGTGGSPLDKDRSGFQITGASVDELIYIRGLGAGRSKIRFIKMRPGVYKTSDKEHVLEVDINN